MWKKALVAAAAACACSPAYSYFEDSGSWSLVTGNGMGAYQFVDSHAHGGTYALVGIKIEGTVSLDELLYTNTAQGSANLYFSPGPPFSLPLFSQITSVSYDDPNCDPSIGGCPGNATASFSAYITDPNVLAGFNNGLGFTVLLDNSSGFTAPGLADSFSASSTGTLTFLSAPEPASWALMVGGFGMIGGAMRSRKKAAIAFA